MLLEDPPAITISEWQAGRVRRMAELAELFAEAPKPREPEPPVRKTPACWRAVWCVDTKEDFPSMAIAARAHGVNATALRMAVKNKHRCGKRLYAYVGQPAPVIVPNNGGRPMRPVRCVETKHEWPSCISLAKELGVHSMTVTRACREGKPIGLRHYEYVARGARRRPRGIRVGWEEVG